MTRTYYDILGVSETATLEEIKKAYHKLALKWHPDRNKSPDATKKMQEISKAFEILGNEEKRKEYDLGETNFSENYGDEFSRDKAKMEELNKQINLMKELIENEKERMTLMSRMVV